MEKMSIRMKYTNTTQQKSSETAAHAPLVFLGVPDGVTTSYVRACETDGKYPRFSWRREPDDDDVGDVERLAYATEEDDAEDGDRAVSSGW